MSEFLLDQALLDGELADLLRAPAWYVAYSGGVDSTVLLHLLHRWCAENTAAPPLCAIHINHGMQSGADDWQLHCEQVCKALNVPILCQSVAVSPASRGGEAAARDARYQAFEQLMQPGAVVFLGHHLDDQIETFFLRLLRGAGLQGLAAIPRRRVLAGGLLARPLLQVQRSQLQYYASHYGLAYVEDPSNSSLVMDRNFLRAELLPLLASRWPGYRQTVARATDHMAAAVAVLQEAVPTPATVHNVMGDPGVAITDLLQDSREVAAVKLRSWLQAAGYLAPDRVALNEFLRQLYDSTQDSAPRLECSDFTLARYRDAVYLLPVQAETSDRQPLSLVPGQICDVPGVGRIGLEPAASDGLSLPRDSAVEIAWRSGGERCRPAGRAHTSSLKKLLQEFDVPPWWRDRLPLLYCKGELLAVADLWLCESSYWSDSARPGQALWQLCWNRNSSAAGD